MALVRIPFDAGWAATVDGQPTTVFPADYVDQGVAVPPGRHTIVLAFRDPLIGWGILGSLLAVLALAAGALFSPGRDAEERAGRTASKVRRTGW